MKKQTSFSNKVKAPKPQLSIAQQGAKSKKLNRSTKMANNKGVTKTNGGKW